MEDEARFFNRELSWLAFNRRVLEEASDLRNPLLERARFLAIVSSNLDEFCMVRLAELRRARHELTRDPAGLLPREQLDLVRRDLHALVEDHYRTWRDEVEPALGDEGFRIVAPRDWTLQDRETLVALFRDRIEPTLTPLAVDPTRPFPLLAGGGIHVAVILRPRERDEAAEDERPRKAMVSVPGGARLLALVGAPGRFALIDDVVEEYIDSLFPGYEILGRGRFRLTRDGSLEIDEDHATDLLSEMEEELRARSHGQAVRLEIEPAAPDVLVSWLREALVLDGEDVVRVDGPLDLTFLMGLSEQLPRPELLYEPLRPRPPAIDWSDPFAALREHELLLHHPFDAFQPLVDLVERAAQDPRVLAIKQTLYRVGADSPITAALMRAARAGKQVTVLLELKARFDEERNIRWARRLEEAGAHVLYGLLGLKVHAKLLLIIRRDEDGIRRYCHLGTGNYNDRTARVYTDLGYLTSNEAVGRDVAALFNILTGFSLPPDWERLAVSPLTMRETFVGWIRREAEHARAGRGGRILAKFNSLVDAEMCEELYAASRAGVEIDLIVRGMCILRPGVPGLSETIRVRSIVGRFLEHSRIYHFGNAGEPVYAIGSADWMTRNLDRRVESLVRIEDPELQHRLEHLLELYLRDNVKARELRCDGSYRRLRPAPGEEERHAQAELLAEGASAAPAAATGPAAGRFVPLRRPGREA